MVPVPIQGGARGRCRSRTAFCVSSGAELLERRTLLDVFTVTGADEIDFNIPGDSVHTIARASPLPNITRR